MLLVITVVYVVDGSKTCPFFSIIQFSDCIVTPITGLARNRIMALIYFLHWSALILQQQ